jgi:hypothetical protein
MKTLVKIAHASFLLDAGRIKVGKSVVRARKGLLIGKAHARQHACAGSRPGLRVQMLTRAMQYSVLNLSAGLHTYGAIRSLADLLLLGLNAAETNS